MSSDMTIPQVYIVPDNGAEYTPVVGTPYMESFLMQAGIQDMSIAFDEITNTKFIYQISISYPKNTQTADINAQANNVLERYKRGTVLNTATDKIRILKSGDVVPLPDTDTHISKAISIEVDVTENI